MFENIFFLFVIDRESSRNALYLKEKSSFAGIVCNLLWQKRKNIYILYTNMDSTNEHKSPRIKTFHISLFTEKCIYLYPGAFFVCDRCDSNADTWSAVCGIKF